jgi:hypothetical protein
MISEEVYTRIEKLLSGIEQFPALNKKQVNITL